MQSFPHNNFPQIFYLHQNYERFWELTIDPSNNCVTERFGNLLQNGAEDLLTVQKRGQYYHSYHEADKTAQFKIAQKKFEGYQFFEESPANPISYEIPVSQSVMVNPNKLQKSDLYPSFDMSKSMKASSLKRRPAEPLERDESKQFKKMDSFNSEVDRMSEASNPNIPQQSGGIGSKIVNFFKRLVKSDTKEEEDSFEEDDHDREVSNNSQFHGNGSMMKSKVNNESNYYHDAPDMRNQVPEDVTNVITLTPFLQGMTPALAKKAEELGIHTQFSDKSLVVQGPHPAISDFLVYVVELQSFPAKEETENKKLESLAKKEMEYSHLKESMANMQKVVTDLQNKIENSPTANEKPPQRELQRSNSEKLIEKGLKFIHDSKDMVHEYVGSFIKKANQMYPHNGEDVGEMAKRLEVLERKVDNQGSRSMNIEFERRFSDLLNFMDDKIKTSNGPNGNLHTSQIRPSMSMSGMNMSMRVEEPEEFVRREIARTSLLRPLLEEIKKKAEELGVVLESVTYEFFSALGHQRNIDKFIIYLHELEVKTKKALHPQFWNFMESRPFSMVTVPPNEKEYKDVTRLFTSYLPEFEIVGLERVQNNYLMDRFINNMQLLKEQNPTLDLSRRQLFHGTRSLNPSFIYKSDDCGLDVRFADNIGSQGYGKGLRFEINPINCHKRGAYRTSNGNYQLLICDVLIGKTRVSGPDGTITKAPQGFHSISENGEFFVIYNNFQSYPLYLLEYRASTDLPQDFIFSSI